VSQVPPDKVVLLFFFLKLFVRTGGDGGTTPARGLFGYNPLIAALLLSHVYLLFELRSVRSVFSVRSVRSVFSVRSVRSVFSLLSSMLDLLLSEYPLVRRVVSARSVFSLPSSSFESRVEVERRDAAGICARWGLRASISSSAANRGDGARDRGGVGGFSLLERRPVFLRDASCMAASCTIEEGINPLSVGAASRKNESVGRAGGGGRIAASDDSGRDETVFGLEECGGIVGTSIDAGRGAI
jgi:hypothetical protein